MRLVIHCQPKLQSSFLSRYIENRAITALDRAQEAVHSVTISLLDQNGDRGGVDKLCRTTVRLRGMRPLILEERGTDAYAVVNKAMRRLRERVGKFMEKVRDVRTRKGRADAVS